MFRDFKILRDLDYVVGVLFFGSSIYDKTSSKHGDLDCFIVLRDDVSKKDLEQVSNVLKRLEASLADRSIKLHLQPVMTLNALLLRLVKREPWIISALSHGLIYKDNLGLLKTLQGVVLKQSISLKSEHTGLLLTRAYDSLIKARKSLLGSITLLTDLYLLITRLLASKHGIVIPDPDSGIRFLERIPEFKSFKQEFEELSLLNKKFEKGTLGEFKGLELDEWLSRCERFFSTVEKTVLKVRESWL